MVQTTLNTDHNDLFDGLSSISTERRARALRAEAVGGFLKGFGAFLRRIGANIHQAAVQRRLVNELSQLDDRLLADVGLTRDNLHEQLVRGSSGQNGFYGKAITGDSVVADATDRPTPANTDVETGRKVA